MPSRSLRQLRAIASDLELRKIDELGKSRLKNIINNMLAKDGIESPYRTAKKECKDLKQIWDRDLFCRQDKRRRHHRNVTRVDDINQRLDKQISDIVYKRKGRRDRTEKRKTMAEREKEEMDKLLKMKWGQKKEEPTQTQYEPEEESVGGKSEMTGQMEDESVSGESEMAGEMEDESVSEKQDVETNTDVFDENEDGFISESILDNTPLPTTPVSSLGGGAATKPSTTSLQEDTIFKQFIQARKDRDVQRFIGMLVEADVLKSRRKKKSGRGKLPEKNKRKYQISGNGNVIQHITFFGSTVDTELRKIQSGNQPIQIIGIQNNYGSQGQQKDADELNKACKELYTAIRTFDKLSWRSYRDVIVGFIKLCFRLIQQILKFVWDYKAVTISALTILLVIYYGGIGNLFSAIILKLLRAFAPGFQTAEGFLDNLGSAYGRVQDGTEKLWGQGMNASKDLFGKGVNSSYDIYGKGMNASQDIWGKGYDVFGQASNASQNIWGQAANSSWGKWETMANETGNATTGFTFPPDDVSSGYTFVPGTVYEGDFGSNYVDTGNATNITDASGFGFGNFSYDTTTGNYTYSNNATSVDSPVFISPESYNEVVDIAIKNMTHALVQNITDKVVENVNVTFTEAINANLNKLTDTLSDKDVIDEIDMLQRDISDEIEDLEKEVTFTLALEAVVSEQILKDKTEKIEQKRFDFVRALKRKLKDAYDGKVEKAIQETFDKMKRNIGRYGAKMKSMYDKPPAFPKELLETIKNKTKNLIKVDLKDLKEFFSEGNSDLLDDILLSEARNVLEQSKQFRFKRMLERAANEDTTDLSQSLTRQVNDNTNSIGEAYQDIVDSLSALTPTEISEIELDGLEEITQSYIENGGLTPMEIPIQAKDSDGDEFNAEPNLSVEETKYYMKLVAVGLGLGIGVSLLHTTRLYFVKPEIAAVIIEGLRYYAGGQFTPGGGRAPAGGGWFSPQQN